MNMSLNKRYLKGQAPIEAFSFPCNPGFSFGDVHGARQNDTAKPVSINKMSLKD